MNNESREEFEAWYQKSINGSDYNLFQSFVSPDDALKIWQASRKNITIYPPLFEYCPECKGTGENKIASSVASCLVGDIYTLRCPKCNGTGKIPIYYTPEGELLRKWNAKHPEHAVKVEGWTAVWAKLDQEWNWEIVPYNECLYYSNEYKETYPMVIYFPKQPAPPKDWRPEE